MWPRTVPICALGKVGVEEIIIQPEDVGRGDGKSNRMDGCEDGSLLDGLISYLCISPLRVRPPAVMI